MSGIDNGEERLERVSSEITQAGARVALTFIANRAGHLTHALLAQGLSSAATSLKWAAAAVRSPGGEVSMKKLSELPSQAGREVVTLEDEHVMRALEKNLRSNGVHYAIEREKIDGQIRYALHVRGDDANVVTHSLERAAEAIAGKQRTPTQQVTEKPERTAAAEKLAQSKPVDASKRTPAETAQFQKELRAKVQARAAKIRAAAPKPAPKLTQSAPVLKR